MGSAITWITVGTSLYRRLIKLLGRNRQFRTARMHQLECQPACLIVAQHGLQQAPDHWHPLRIALRIIPYRVGVRK